ncbi:hypothetical protein FLL45_00400 [Aliikangiella marina]|uniref:Tetratricopeptide repeat protein n=1 Tax=Aliikangiella marina TaxID=1712262 RepID=A0A545TGU7_9GAMM|nr:hypothetical protein [Aliikangiella marina]TQV76460.1 hypothetical protein FLL45_00400 [Aliikangiella marina]
MINQSTLRLFILSLALIAINVSAQPTRSGDLDKQIQSVGEQFARALNQQDIRAMKVILDVDPLAIETYQLVFGDSDQSGKNSFIKGFKDTFFSKSVSAWFLSLQRSGGVAEYQRNIRVDGTTRALIRLNLNAEGVNYMELIFDKNNKRVVDMFVHTTGEKLSDTMISIVALAVPNNENLLSRLLGTKKLDNQVIKAIGQVVEFNRTGQFAKAHETLNNLPKEVQNSRYVTVMKVTLSSSVSEDAYYKELENLANLYGNESTLGFLLVDYYFIKGQFDRLVQTIETVEKRIGVDSILESLKANAYFMAQRHNLAMKHIEKAIAMEASNQEFYWIKAEVLNKQKKFQGLTDLFDDMATRFSLTFDPSVFEGEPEYLEFAKSAAFKTWAKQYRP